MKATLQFETRKMMMSDLGEQASVPDLTGGFILQNNLEFYLDEDDEIFEGYGTRPNSYPYRQYNRYTRELKSKKMKVAILENEFICAMFLPELGGRLWSLIDKVEGKNLLYTNDVIRYSNLSTRNAWFSGGVEWNVGVIGHTPLTTEPMFTASLKDEDGNPVLRMYEYERISGVEYQIDFWLGEKDTFLNCRMRIVNSSKDMIPMYWWSNIAVPEHRGGRIIVPAKKAYTYRSKSVHKVDIPMVDDIDISRYENIPVQVDYFFKIPKENPKYIANVNHEGYGLLQLSTQRLQSRKLFSWGNKGASERWQDFLTDQAGRYVEIQAGLGKTQYGCIPMAPHTAWEWMEQYGPIQVDKEVIQSSFEQLTQKVTAFVSTEAENRQIEEILTATKLMAKTPGKLVYQGSGYGALKNICREKVQDRPLSKHLDFGVCQAPQLEWAQFLVTGYLKEESTDSVPKDFMYDDIFYEQLKSTIQTKNKDNSYAHYQLGILYFVHKKYKKAEKECKISLALKENAWAYHGIASVALLHKEHKKAIKNIKKGMKLRKNDLSYLKEGFKILLLCEAYKDVIQIRATLSKKMKKDARIEFTYINALYKTGKVQKAYDRLLAKGGLELSDVREGDDSIGELWKEMHFNLYGKDAPIPYQFQFNSLS